MRSPVDVGRHDANALRRCLESAATQRESSPDWSYEMLDDSHELGLPTPLPLFTSRSPCDHVVTNEIRPDCRMVDALPVRAQQTHRVSLLFN